MVDRLYIDKALAEQRIQRSSITEELAVTAGRYMNVSKVVVGKVYISFDGGYQVDVTVLDVQSGLQVASEGTTVTPGNYRQSIQQLAQRLAGKIAIKPGQTVAPTKPTTNNTTTTTPRTAGCRIATTTHPVTATTTTGSVLSCSRSLAEGNRVALLNRFLSGFGNFAEQKECLFMVPQQLVLVRLILPEYSGCFSFLFVLAPIRQNRQNFAILAHFCKKNFAILAHFYEKDFAERKKGCTIIMN